MEPKYICLFCFYTINSCLSDGQGLRYVCIIVLIYVYRRSKCLIIEKNCTSYLHCCNCIFSLYPNSDLKENLYKKVCFIIFFSRLYLPSFTYSGGPVRSTRNVQYTIRQKRKWHHLTHEQLSKEHEKTTIQKKYLYY